MVEVYNRIKQVLTLGHCRLIYCHIQHAAPILSVHTSHYSVLCTEWLHTQKSFTYTHSGVLLDIIQFFGCWFSVWFCPISCVKWPFFSLKMSSLNSPHLIEAWVLVKLCEDWYSGKGLWVVIGGCQRFELY